MNTADFVAEYDVDFISHLDTAYPDQSPAFHKHIDTLLARSDVLANDVVTQTLQAWAQALSSHSDQKIEREEKRPSKPPEIFQEQQSSSAISASPADTLDASIHKAELYQAIASATLASPATTAGITEEMLPTSASRWLSLGTSTNLSSSASMLQHLSGLNLNREQGSACASPSSLPQVTSETASPILYGMQTQDEKNEAKEEQFIARPLHEVKREDAVSGTDIERNIQQLLAERKLHDSTFGETSIVIDASVEQPLKLHAEMKYDYVCNLLKLAHDGHPHALYRLGHFYYQESNAAPQQRIVEAPCARGQSEKDRLQEISRICFEAAANLGHPHAAYQLLELFSSHYEVTKRLAFAHVANFKPDATNSVYLNKTGRTPAEFQVTVRQPNGTEKSKVLVHETPMRYGSLAKSKEALGQVASPGLPRVSVSGATLESQRLGSESSSRTQESLGTPPVQSFLRRRVINGAHSSTGASNASASSTSNAPSAHGYKRT